MTKVINNLYGNIKNSNFFTCLFVIVTYFLCAEFSKYLPQVSGLESPIWPATGVALALVLLMGYRAVPGIFIGNLMSNFLGIELFNSAQLSSISIFQSVDLWQNMLFAFGAASQAFIGAYLVRKFNYFPYNFSGPKKTTMFFLIAGPVASVIGSTLGSFFILFDEKITLSELPYSWFSWWIGDTASVLIFTTLGLALFTFDKNRKVIVSSLLFIVFSLTVVIYSLGMTWNKERLDLLFEQEIIALENSIELKKESYHSILVFMNNLMDSKDNITRENFNHFSKSVLSHNPSIMGLNWNEVVTLDERDKFEGELSTLYGQEKFIWHRDNEGLKIPAIAKDDYVAVKFIEPYDIFIDAIGFDIKNIEIRNQALNDAYKSRSPGMTAPLTLPEENQEIIVVMYYPNFRDDHLHGYSTLAVKMNDMISEILTDNFRTDFNFSILDFTADESSQLLFRSEMIDRDPDKVFRVEIPIFNRTWTAELSRSQYFNEQNKSIEHILIGMVGMALASIISIGIVIVSGQRLFLENLVKIRTADLEKADKIKSEFMANMSHELRTPLNAIIGFSDIIKQEIFGAIGSKKYKGYIGDILNSSQHLLSLINDILDISAMESGQLSLKKESINSAELINECYNSLHPLSHAKDISCEIKSKDELPDVIADHRALKQIFVNLISNSIKFTPEGGKITIHVSCENDFMQFQVIDNGQGIKEKDMEKIIEPFTRVENDPHLSQEGSGLGLAIVNSLIKLHGGKFTIKSVPKKGTTATIHLPLNVKHKI
ncbi:MAG: CHASE domain-containing protein [Emcibacteraceae bacterium]|nr:CHASE domain-containing protein [Emcibacteraceae bacterium]